MWYVQWYFRETILVVVFSIHEKMENGEGFNCGEQFCNPDMKRVKPDWNSGFNLFMSGMVGGGEWQI